MHEKRNKYFQRKKFFGQLPTIRNSYLETWSQAKKGALQLEK